MLFDDQYIQQRIEKSEELKGMGVNPYRHNAKRDTSTCAFLNRFDYLKEKLEGERSEPEVKTCITGRVKFLRLMGKAAFAKIEDEKGVLQIYYSKNDLGDEAFTVAKKHIEVGDIVEVSGFPFITKTGELTLHALELNLLTKSIIPLPEKYHGLTDKELRYRHRYVDLIMNREVKDVFMLRSKIVSLVRGFFEEIGFLEVETPMMHPIAGGANARPFVTHHNALDVQRFLRIAPELYLKRLIVGGFEAVFEINRNFRNEGMDHSHNPEFTMVEFYKAYGTYTELMDLTEKLFNRLFEKLELPKQLPYDDLEINFGSPFKRIKYVDAIVEIGGIDRDTATDKEKAHAFLKQNGIEIHKDFSLGHMQAELFDNFVEEKLINPTFITDFPITISPLARRSDENPDIAERFELFIARKEIANGFNELNDPIDQYGRFKAQVEAKELGDDEACEMDEDFVRALGYGMPPTAGEGIGIDRLVMVLTNQHSIRDVILFPAMRPEKAETQNTEPVKQEKE